MTQFASTEAAFLAPHLCIAWPLAQTSSASAPPLVFSPLSNLLPVSTMSPNPRWLSEQKARLGRCIMFGLRGRQVEEAGRLARVLGEEWKGLVAGTDGYLVSPQAQSLLGKRTEDAWEERVVWGEQVRAASERMVQNL